jgi:hypothetical protein
MSIEPEAETHPGLTALDLANLAAKLDPVLCLRDAEAACKLAFEFYQLACFWMDRQPTPTAFELAQDAGTQLDDKIFRILGNKNREIIEKEKLRFYPDLQTTDDDVRRFLGVKSARAVKNKLRKWFRVLAARKGDSSQEGDLEFQRYLEAAQGKDNAGRFYALPKHLLQGVKSLGREIKEKGGLKAIGASPSSVEVEQNPTVTDTSHVMPPPYVGSQAEEDAHRVKKARRRATTHESRQGKLPGRRPKGKNVKGRSF